MKKVIVQFNIPNLTAQTYDKIWEELRSTGNANPQGLLYHAGGPQGNNWVVTDIWESAEAFQNFGGTLGPIMAKHNVADSQPVITPLYYEYVGTPAAKAR